MKKDIYVYDLETYPNFFLYSFKSLTTGKVIHFEISDRKNEFYELKEFLLSGKIKYLVGFNNLSFDYPVMHKTVILPRRPLSLKQMYRIVTDEVLGQKYSAIKDKQIRVPQVDLYKIWHYDNINKATSLKWIEFALRLENIEDLPYTPGTMLTDEQKDVVISYCENDLTATEEFLHKSIKHITLRKTFTQLERLPCMNYSEIMLSKQILLKKLSKEAMMDKWILNRQRSIRKEVKIDEIIFDYIQFKHSENQKVMDIFRSKVWKYDIDQEKALESIKFTTQYKNVTREYAEGGLHSFGKPGIYYSNKDYVLVDVDFASYYPHLTFKNGLHPEHIDSKVFNEIYEGFYHERKKYPKSDPRNYVLKIVLNGTYGLSKDKYSFLYDPKWQLAICINGQLLLTLLTERVYEACEKPVQIIFENTDGAMYRIHRSDFDNLTRACHEVEEICRIPLETQICQKIIARDVNNYINIIDDDNIKFKGAFEIDRDFHKNHSKRVVPIALANYYVHGVPVGRTIKNHLAGIDYPFAKNHGILDFCLGAKMKGQNKLYARIEKSNMTAFSEEDKKEIARNNGWYEWHGGSWMKEGMSDRSATTLDYAFRSSLKSEDWYKDTPLSKITRYYVSNQGVELIKKLPPLPKNELTYTDKHKMSIDPNQMDLFDVVEDVKIDTPDRESNLEVGYRCTVMNKLEYKKPEEYDINYDYYINECNKIIEKCGKNITIPKYKMLTKEIS